MTRRTFAGYAGPSLAASQASGSSLPDPEKGEAAVTFSDKPRPTLQKKHLTIGCLVFERQDQIDFTGPYEVFARIPESTIHVIGKTKAPVKDVKGLILTPDTAIAEAPSLDVLLCPVDLGSRH